MPPREMLESVCEFVTDGTHGSPERTSTGIPVLSAQHVKNGALEFDTDRFTSNSEYSDFARRVSLQSGDVLLTIVGSIGRAAVVTGPPPLVLQRSVGILRPKANFLDSRYLYYATQSADFQRQLARSTNRSAQAGVYLGKLKAIEVPIPSLPEQKRIVEILDEADAICRLRRQSLSRLSGLGPAYFYDMFGDPISNPMGWEQVRLGDLCDVGSSKRVFAKEFREEGIPFYRGTEVGKLGAGERIEPTLFIERSHYDSLVLHSGKPSIGDLLLPSICHDGRIWTVDNEQPFYFKDGRVLWIKSSKSPINGDYLRNQLCNMLLHNYHAIASGSNFAELKIVNLKNLKLLNPPVELQQRFAQYIKAIGEKQRAYEKAAKETDELFASLQHRAFRGEL